MLLRAPASTGAQSVPPEGLSTKLAARLGAQGLLLHEADKNFLSVSTPVDVVTIANCSFKNNSIRFRDNEAMPDYFKTQINLIGCVFNKPGKMDLLVNGLANRVITLKTTASVELSDKFSAVVVPGRGTITVDSDLTGLKN